MTETISKSVQISISTSITLEGNLNIPQNAQGIVVFAHEVAKALHAEVALNASQESLEILKTEADEVVCLHAPELFYAVGVHYQSFPQLTDDDVIEILTKSF